MTDGELPRRRSDGDEWEEVSAVGQWSALERGIRSIRSELVQWRSAELLPTAADPRKMRVTALADSRVLPDELIRDISVCDRRASCL